MAFLNPDQVTRDSAFSLREAGGQERWFVMEPENPNLSEEIAPDSSLAQRVMGKRAGDVVMVSEMGLIRDQRTISSIKHRALHALHETMSRFSEWFPGHTGLFKVQVRKDESGGVDTSEIETILRAKEELTKRGIEVYRSGQMPVAALAEVFGVNPIEVWFGLPTDAETEVICCSGTLAERTAAMQLIRSHPSWLVDSITLVEMHALGVHEEVLTVAGKMGICQSSLDLLEELRRSRFADEPQMRIAMKDGALVRIEIAPEDRESQRAFAQGVYEWAKNRLELVPAIGRRDRPPDRKITELLGRAYHDILIATEGDARSLLCEDSPFRSLVQTVCGAKGAWLQPFLFVGLENGTLDSAKFLHLRFRSGFAITSREVSLRGNSYVSHARRVSRKA